MNIFVFFFGWPFVWRVFCRSLRRDKSAHCVLEKALYSTDSTAKGLIGASWFEQASFLPPRCARPVSSTRPPQLDCLTNNLRVSVILQYFSYHTLLFWRLPPVPRSYLSALLIDDRLLLVRPGSQRVTSFATIQSSSLCIAKMRGTQKKAKNEALEDTANRRPAMLIGGYWSVKSSAAAVIKCCLCIPFLIEGIERIIHAELVVIGHSFPIAYTTRDHTITHSPIHVRIVCCKAEEMWCVIDSSDVLFFFLKENIFLIVFFPANYFFIILESRDYSEFSLSG